MNCIRKLKADFHIHTQEDPNFPILQGLRSGLDEAIDIFDVIDNTHFFLKGINFNRKAARFYLSLLGVSDAHFLWQVGTTDCLIELEKDIRSVIRAIKKRRVEIISSPMRFTSSNVLLGLRHLTGQVFDHKYWFKSRC